MSRWFGMTVLAVALLPVPSLRAEQISGPDWIDTDCYTVIARVPAGRTRAEMNVMLQNLVTSRFQLVAHHEMRGFPNALEVLMIDHVERNPGEQK